jgi:hypothetical protein
MMFSQPLIGPQPVLSVLAIGAIVGSVLINIAARIWK